jgi:hypothetical protein
MSYIRYRNQGATRNQQLSDDLLKRLTYLEQMGITAEVFSGGQPGKGSGLARVGSTRHDHGHAGDMFFYQGDRKLNWANPEDRPIFEDIVRKGKQAGITGWGAGPGYMSEGSMHVGMGNPGVWGAGGSGKNAPAWLKNAFYGTNDATDPVQSSTMIAEVPERKPLPSFGELMAAKASATPTTATNTTTPTAVPDDKPDTRNGPLIQAWNKFTGQNVQIPEKIAGIKTDKIASGLSGVGDFMSAIAEQNDELNRQIQASVPQHGRLSSAPVEMEFAQVERLDPRKKKRRGGLAGLGGYLI